MATLVEKYVVTNAASTSGSTVSGTGTIGDPYNSLRFLAGLTAGEKDLIANDETWVIHVAQSGGYWDRVSSDTGISLGEDWKLDADHQLVITGDGQYHNGHIPELAYGSPFGVNTSFGSYVRACSNHTGAFVVSAPFVTLRGFQVLNFRAIGECPVVLLPSNATSNVTLDRMLIRGAGNAAVNDNDVGVWVVGAVQNLTVKNCGIHKLKHGVRMQIGGSSAGHEIHYNTIYRTPGTTTGNGIVCNGNTHISGNCSNNIIQNVAAAGDLLSLSGGTWTTSNNLTEDASGEIQATLTFADTGDNDFHLNPMDSSAKGSGIAVSGITEDVDLQTRFPTYINVGFDQTAIPVVKTSITDFVFIFNQCGDECTSLELIEGVKNSHPHFKNQNIAYGPRARRWRSTETNENKAIGYIHPERNINIFAITEGYFADSLAGYNVDIGHWTGAAWEWTELEAPLSSASLVGKSNQDIVQPVEDISTLGAAVRFRPATGGTEAVQFSSLVVGEYLNIGSPDVGSVEIEDLNEQERRFRHIRGYDVFETTKRITMRFTGLTLAQIGSWRAVPTLYRWPFLLYDPSQYVFPHKLEHVVLEDWEASQLDRDIWTLEISVRRLRHYEHAN